MIYLTHGVNSDGQLIAVESVSRGKTALRCPYCNMPLIARRGAQIAPHFAHDGQTCREVKRSADAIALPAYNSFQLHLKPHVWEALQQFHNEEKHFYVPDILEENGLINVFTDYFGRSRHSLTHKGKIPFGELSLDLFNKYQEPLITGKYEDMAWAARQAFGRDDSTMLFVDLKLYATQVKRILDTALYFIEVQTDRGILHKIGVTSRPLDQRLNEIRLDLMPHFGTVKLKPLGTWARRGNVEHYFKYRYQRYQKPIGTLTEYFAFDNIKSVLRDLRRMKEKQLTTIEQSILEDNLSQLDLYKPQPNETLSPEAWQALCEMTLESIDRRSRTWNELHNFRWQGEHRPLIEPTPGTNEYTPRRTKFGEAYYTVVKSFE